MSIEALKSEVARQFGTPAVVIDLDVVERNIARVQALCDAAGIANRPHIKTHKSPVIAAMQRDAGARGITCQKLGEAEIMAEGGHDDILIAYNLLGEEKMARLGRLLSQAKVTVAADNPVVVAGLPEAAAIAGRDLDVVVECDTGRKRAGVETVAEAVALARDIASRPGLSLRRLHAVSAGGRHGRDAGLPRQGHRRHQGVRARAAHRLDGRHAQPAQSRQDQRRNRAPGRHFVFNDRMMLAAGVAGLEDCALTVYATVVSRAGPERGILDSGSKTLTSDTGGGLDGHGLILEHPAGQDRPLSRKSTAFSISPPATTGPASATWCASCRTMSAWWSTWWTVWSPCGETGSSANCRSRQGAG